MNGNIYKVAASITKEEILENCEYGGIPEYGKVMSYGEFLDCVECYCITDYDGNGNIVLFGKVVENAHLWIHNRSVYFSNKFFVPFDILHSIFGNDMNFIWFNK